MADYTALLGDFPSKLASSKRVLIAISKYLSIDSLASALSLALALQKNGKTVSVVSEGSPLVSHSHLFGIGDVKNSVPSSGEGNFIIKLDGVVDPSGQMNTVPSLEKLDWYPEGSALNLVFHVVPGQRFEPTQVSYNHENSGFDLIITVDADSLDELGQIYLKNAALFSKSTVVNIDNEPSNSQFGNINIVDPQASSLSEIMVNLLRNLNLEMDGDVASNLVAGIYTATANLTQRVNPDTFAAVATLMQAGGKLPEAGVAPSEPEPQTVVPVVEEQVPVTPVQPVNQIQFNQSTGNSQQLTAGSISSPLSSQSLAETVSPQAASASQDKPVVESVQPESNQAPEVVAQPVQEPVSAPTSNDSTSAAPADSTSSPQANDLYSNPFLNPTGQAFGAPAPVAPAPTSSANDPFGAPASGPTFNFGSFGGDTQSTADSQQLTAASASQEPVQSIPVPQPEQPDVSGILNTIQQANKPDDAYDLKQIFNVEQMPETPVVGNTTHDSALNQPTGNSQQVTATPISPIQAQPIQDSKPNSSPEEKPAGEAVMSTNPEAEANPTPDWLVPKIFKGGSLG